MLCLFLVTVANLNKQGSFRNWGGGNILMERGVPSTERGATLPSEKPSEIYCVQCVIYKTTQTPPAGY